ncbi:tRNA (cytosine(34)-C(5))-methyltransferase, mitochondrial isoform 3-T3 [Trichechus inunguis]
MNSGEFRKLECTFCFRDEREIFGCCRFLVCLVAPGGMMLTRLKANSEGKLAKQICKVVLDHFEKQYSRELGDAWSTTRDILTSPSCWQYAVLFNRFNYPFELEKDLHLKGYHTLVQGSLPYCPESVKCYLSRTPDRMPSERHQMGILKKYYLLNAASLLPVLALELRDGEKVLDLCAAPGGKSVALLQCAYPGYLHCNESDSLRSRWLRQTLESFIPQPVVNVIKVSELDGREMGDAQPETFDKVLVDAPCSNDRSWLFSSDSQKAACRISQRRKLPLLQIELLSLWARALLCDLTILGSSLQLCESGEGSILTHRLETFQSLQLVYLTLAFRWQFNPQMDLQRDSSTCHILQT